MVGRITTWHLFWYSFTIVHEYGWKVYWKAWVSSTHGGTFLEAIRKARKK